MLWASVRMCLLFANLDRFPAHLCIFQHNMDMPVTKYDANLFERPTLSFWTYEPQKRDECGETAKVDENNSAQFRQLSVPEKESLCWLSYLQPILANAVGAVSSCMSSTRKYAPMEIDIPFPRAMFGKISEV